MALEVMNITCPGCGAPIDTKLAKCYQCGRPYVITSFNNVYGMTPNIAMGLKGAYQKEVEANPDNPDANFSLGICLLKLNMYDKAYEKFDKAIEDEPEDEDEAIDDEPEDEDESINDEPEDEDEAIEKDDDNQSDEDEGNNDTPNNTSFKIKESDNNYDVNNNDIEDKFNTDKKDFMDELQKYVNRDPERDRPDEEYSKPKQDEIQRERIKGSEFDTRYDDSNDNKNANLDNSNSDYSPKADINNLAQDSENDIYNPTPNSQNDINNNISNNQNDINNYGNANYNTPNVDSQYEMPNENKDISDRLKDDFNERQKIKEYNSKLPEIQNQMDDFAKSEELDKYVVNKDVLNKPLSESVEARGNNGINERLDEINRNLPEEKQIHNKGNIAGFNDGNKSYINVDVDTTPEATTLHENMHQISTNTYKNLDTGDIYSMSGISKNGADTQVNEGLTEYYAKKAMGDKYPGDTSIYKNNTERSARLENLVGSDELKRAYFGNTPEILESKFTEYSGDNNLWKKYSEACELSVKGETKEIRDANNAKANDILRYLEYMKSEGDKPVI